MLDRLIRTSVERLDRSEGLPSNFAYRMAMRASAEKARRAAASRRREQLLAWIVPVVMAIAAIVALWLTMPTLPSTLTRSVAEGGRKQHVGVVDNHVELHHRSHCHPSGSREHFQAQNGPPRKQVTISLLTKST